MNDTFHDVIALTQALIGFDTVNQPGQEAAIMAFVAEGLREAGFDCTLVKHAKDRASLIATKGTGMGLAMAYGTMISHNGWIQVQSQLGLGSSFDLILPASSADAASIPTRTSSFLSTDMV